MKEHLSRSKKGTLCKGARMKRKSMASISTGAHGSVEEALSILNQETFTIDLKILEQWCNGDKRLLAEDVISEVLKQAHPHKAILFYLWTGRRCHNQMVRKLLDEGWYEKAVELLDDEKRSDQQTYSMVISALPSYHEHTESVVQAMLKHGYTLDPKLFKKVYEMLKHHELIECYKQCSTAADEEVCQLVLVAMAREKMFQEACELVKYMVARGFEPWLQALFRELLQAGMSDDAYKVLEIVDDEGAHNDLIRALDYDDVDKIGELVNRMIARGYTPYVRRLFDGLLAAGRDKDAYAALEMVGGEEAHCDFIRALLTFKRYEDAHQFVEDMIGRHPEHFEKCFDTLVHDELFLDDKQIVRAFDLMNMAIATAGITPDPDSCIAVASALRNAGRIKEASYIFKFVKRFSSDVYDSAYDELHQFG